MEFDEKLLKEKYFTEALEEIKKVVAIPSFSGEPTAEAPFGPDVLKVLHYTIDLAKSMGFKTHIDEKNMYGYVEYGSGDEIFAILGHLDVVPPGNLEEWNIPPFAPEIVDDILYGRGVLDDKGPTIVILYCLKYLKDHNFVPKRRIRLLFGLDEETTWYSIAAYTDKEGMPTFGFTPDGMFPLVYAEKGIVNLDIMGPGDSTIKVDGGIAYNVTCATTSIENVDLDKFNEIATQRDYRIEKQDNKIILHGEPAHGSKPEEGINAGLRTLLVLKEMGVDHPIVNFVAEVLKEDTALREHFGKYDDESGPLSFNVGIVQLNDKEGKIGCNVRFPVKTPKETILGDLQKLMDPYGLTFVEKHYDKPLYIPTDSPIVVELMKIYKEVTKDETCEPIAIGGGTYARAIPNCVAFGAIFDDATATEHLYNEMIKVSELWDAMLIYVRAINILGTLDKVV